MFRPRPSSLYTFPFVLNRLGSALSVKSSPTLSASHRAFPTLRLRGFIPSLLCLPVPPSSQMNLLLIVFDGVGRTHVRDLGILSRVAARAALT
jgi:hypothetical protein